MNMKVLVVLCIALVVVTMMMEQAAAGRCRYRCRYSCNPRCGMHCGIHCRGRDEPEQMAPVDESDHVTNNFNEYDENKDRETSSKEYQNVITTDDNQDFSALDTDVFKRQNLEKRARYYCLVCITNRCIIIICARVKKTAQGERVSEVEKSGTSVQRRFPSKFSEYDTNSDEQISFNEFKTAISHFKNGKELRKVLDDIDKNGDGKIWCDEFLAAPLNFEKAPVCE